MIKTSLTIAFICTVMGVLIGALTNTVNGFISPTYFVNVIHWHDIDNLWRASVAQGVFEGLIYGVLFAVVFATVFGIVTRGECPYRTALRFLVGVFLAVLVCWAVGGLIAMGLATLSPEFYRRTFIGVPEDAAKMLGYAWVGGSIWGAMFGGLLGVTVGSVLFRNQWKRRLPQ